MIRSDGVVFEDHAVFHLPSNLAFHGHVRGLQHKRYIIRMYIPTHTYNIYVTQYPA